jgi:hypothetical protein
MNLKAVLVGAMIPPDRDPSCADRISYRTRTRYTSSNLWSNNTIKAPRTFPHIVVINLPPGLEQGFMSRSKLSSKKL